MIAFGDIKELNKFIRQIIIRHTSLTNEQVLNSLSVHGEDLNKLFQDSVYVSINRQDALMLFELRSRTNDADMSQSEDDGSITSYRSFEMYLIIYGSQSSDIATTLCAKFRSDKVRQELRDYGIYLESIDEPDIRNEYINETMWLRNDISMKISCKFLIDFEENHEFEKSKIDVIHI